MSKLIGLIQREPVRVYVYSVVVAVLAALATFGTITDNAVPVIIGMAATVLSVPAVETARAKTTVTAATTAVTPTTTTGGTSA